MLYGVGDFLAGTALMVPLAAAMVGALHAADPAVVLGGGRRIVGVAALLADFGRNPGAAGHWWVYAPLFSTLISSTLNAVIERSACW